MSPIKKAPRSTGLLSFGVMKSSPSIKLRQDHTPRRSAELDRFGNLAGKPTRVTKSEVDEKRAKS
jgi:hypothetical protein